MHIVYPDFAFTRAAQLLLFFVNMFVTTLSYYWGADLLLIVFQKDVSFKRKILFSAIPAVILDIFVVYGIALVNGLLLGMNDLYIGIFEIPTKTMLPIAYFVLYILGVRILRLSSVKSIKLMQIVYVFYVSCTVVLRIVGFLIFPKIPDARGYNSLRYGLLLSLGTIIVFVVYLIFRRLIIRYKLFVNFSDNILVRDTRKELLKNFALCCLVYLGVTAVYYYPKLDGIHCVILLFVCLSIIVGTIAELCTKISKQNLDNKEEHIAALSRSIREFSGIRHDFNNILQTYSGFLAIEAYDRLNIYHQKLVGTTNFNAKYLNFSQRM